MLCAKTFAKNLGSILEMMPLRRKRKRRKRKRNHFCCMSTVSATLPVSSLMFKVTPLYR